MKLVIFCECLDRNSLDFFLWENLETLIYSQPIQTEEELRHRMLCLCETIKNTPGIFQRVLRQ